MTRSHAITRGSPDSTHGPEDTAAGQLKSADMVTGRAVQKLRDSDANRRPTVSGPVLLPSAIPQALPPLKISHPAFAHA